MKKIFLAAIAVALVAASIQVATTKVDARGLKNFSCEQKKAVGKDKKKSCE